MMRRSLQNHHGNGAPGRLIPANESHGRAQRARARGLRRATAITIVEGARSFHIAPHFEHRTEVDMALPLAHHRLHLGVGLTWDWTAALHWHAPSCYIHAHCAVQCARARGHALRAMGSARTPRRYSHPRAAHAHARASMGMLCNAPRAAQRVHASRACCYMEVRASPAAWSLNNDLVVARTLPETYAYALSLLAPADNWQLCKKKKNL
mmetsp:Transcript_31960/g.101910  ORF Transcript_31960/g.101910 Transcript_31960/m.101910 type:complete len:209 (-) Transcript_31960:11-637(-)